MGEGPYRAGTGEAPSGPLEDTGIVGELIEQFADPFAFYRELVQNAIDAGTDAVRIHCTLDESAGEATVAVRDTGEGMDRDILENQLLVLFRSGKEKRTDAIGKFGVGFVSVLAIEPTLVAVHTSRGDGRGWALHLHPDQTYELFELAGGSTSGTTVTMHVSMTRDGFPPFLDQSERALSRWCRHARVPIHFVASIAGRTEPVRDARIDRALDLTAIVHVTSSYDDERGSLIVGLPEPDGTYGGFFNGGLTLWETREAILGKLAFKVQDPRLEHTLSRDNVRRDDAFERAMRAVLDVARSDLVDEAFRRLEAWAADPRTHEYHALAVALHAAELEARRNRWFFPSIAGAPLSAGRVDERTLYATRSSELTDALGAAGVPVLDLAELPSNLFHDYVAVIRAAAPGWRALDAHEQLTLVLPEDHTPTDQLLLDRLSSVLQRVSRRPQGPLFARLVGAQASSTLVMGGGEGGRPWLVSSREASRDPLKFLGRPRMVLCSNHPVVSAARSRAASDPDVAGALLARSVLLALERLDAETDDDVLEAAVAEALRGVG